jgi:hypothetical protein
MFEEPFTLRINEISYNVQPPTLFASNKPARDTLSDVSNSVTKLYHDLRLNQYVMYREQELEKQLAFLRESAQPLNELHHQLAKKAIRRLKWLVNFDPFARKNKISVITRAFCIPLLKTFNNLPQISKQLFVCFRIQWSIFAAMSFQTGVLFRLVWIDYRYFNFSKKAFFSSTFCIF